MTSAFVVMGYNNTRLGDVKRLEAYARDFHDAELVLCKGGISESDRAAVRHCIECDLLPTAENVDLIMEYLRVNSIDAIGVLPFADKGVPIGALLSVRLGRPGAEPEKAQGAADKHLYRMNEKRHQGLPSFLRHVRSREVGTLADARAFWDEVSPGRIFLKPKGEGNSRGCTRVDRLEDLDDAFAGIRPYLSGGVVAEECVDDAREYSVDHVAGFSWVTEKATTAGAYRAEIQQIVPAPLDPGIEDRIERSGFAAAEVCGYSGGAFHNEVFLLRRGQETAVVEPNLRPAGMQIWDLAALAFDFDPWSAWLNYSRYGKLVEVPVRRKGYAGIRMLRAATEGVVSSLPELSEMRNRYPGVQEIVLSRAVGDRVTTRIENNADFIGYVMCSSPSYEETQAALLACATNIESAVGVVAA